MSYNLFLDDVRYPYIKNCNDKIFSAYHYTNFKPFKVEKWIIARNYDEFVDIITSKGLPKLISFDHDLDIEHYLHMDKKKY